MEGAVSAFSLSVHLGLEEQTARRREEGRGGREGGDGGGEKGGGEGEGGLKPTEPCPSHLVWVSILQLNLSENHHRHSQRCVSQATLNPVKSIRNISALALPTS